jgi:hypothetical protein
VLFRRTVFNRVGLLDEAFESYLEDVEFGVRCAEHGIRGMYVPEAVAWHRGSAALGRWHPEMVRRIARNQRCLVARHFPRPRGWSVIVAQGLWGLLALRHGAGLAWLRGVRETGRALPRFDPPAPQDWLESNEQLIREIQQATGWDWYWRLYFLLNELK